MIEIKSGDRVRVLDNQNIPGHLRNQSGTVIEIRRRRLAKEEVMVKLSSGGTVYVLRHELTKAD